MMRKLILVGITGISAFAFWWRTEPWINDSSRFSDVSAWLWPLILFILLSALFCLSFLLLPQKLRLLTVSLNLIAFVVFFGVKEVLLLAVAIPFLFQLSAISVIENESENRLKFKFRSILRPGMARLITSLLILVSFAYFLSPVIQSSAEKKEIPPVIQKTIQMLVGNYVGEDLGAESPRLKAETTSLLLREVSDFLQPYFKFLPPILAFALFIVLQGLSVIFVWLSILLAFIIFMILKMTGLVKIEKESKEAEKISFE